MNVRKTDCFIEDIERQYHWYVVKAGLEVADGYLDTLQATCQLLGRHPFLGPQAGFTHTRLRDWRFFLAFRPFQKHVLSYQIIAGEVLMRRAMHGHRDLARKLLKPSGAD
jgi:plasmid stabilization system protein ParE